MDKYLVVWYCTTEEESTNKPHGTLLNKHNESQARTTI